MVGNEKGAEKISLLFFKDENMVKIIGPIKDKLKNIKKEYMVIICFLFCLGNFFHSLLPC